MTTKHAVWVADKKAAQDVVDDARKVIDEWEKAEEEAWAEIAAKVVFSVKAAVMVVIIVMVVMARSSVRRSESGENGYNPSGTQIWNYYESK